MPEKSELVSNGVYEQYGDDPRVVAGLSPEDLRRAQAQALARLLKAKGSTLGQALDTAFNGGIEGAARSTDSLYQ